MLSARPQNRRSARALAVVAEASGTPASVAEATPEGVRILATSGEAPAAERARREADLRACGLSRLHAEGLLPAGNRRSEVELD